MFPRQNLARKQLIKYRGITVEYTPYTLMCFQLFMC